MDALPLRIAVTGHRPDGLFGYDFAHPGWQWIRDELQRILTEFSAQGPVECVSGMAIGVDQVFAEEVLAAGLPLVAFVPFEGQERRWPPAAQRHYHDLLSRALRRLTVSTAAWRQAFLDRNQAMVQACDVMVAVWTGKESGGTYHCLGAALRAGRPVLWVDPVRRRSVLVGA